MAPARVVGVDDWAWRRGHHYGTIVVDLEKNDVIDTSCQIGTLIPLPDGCRSTPVLKSLPETVPVLMQTEAAEAHHPLFR